MQPRLLHRAPGADPVQWHRLLDQAVARLLPPTCVLCGATGHLRAGSLRGLPGGLATQSPCLFSLRPPLAVGPASHRGLRCLPRPAATPGRQPYPLSLPGRHPIPGDRGQISRPAQPGALAGALPGTLTAPGGRIRRPDIILPVPLHPQRMRERGYNQALEIARALSRELAIPVDPSLCARLRATPPQVGLEREERRHNVRGAFGVIGPVAARHLVILDDVVTTGGTAGELARVLRQAGAARIDLWAVARTP
jgi:hypothetical protein